MAEPYHTGETLCVGRKTRYRPGVYRDLRISNFRRFQHFTMEGLGRVNLLVGPNNCGKTTVLEAIDLLHDHPDPLTLGEKCLFRGAVSARDGAISLDSARLVLRHLFHGHVVKDQSSFSIAGHSRDTEQVLQVSITAQPAQPSGSENSSVNLPGLLWLNWQRSGAAAVDSIRLLSGADWLFSDWRVRAGSMMGLFHVPFVHASSWSRDSVGSQLEEVALNPEEELILDIIRLVEPKVERITSVSVPELPYLPDRGGIFVKLKGQRERIPIASLGEGMWRLLALALALVKAKGSILLVDEIDIGLHYTAQADMWRMVKRAAEELDVQVFATTHSRDCIYALAQVARADVTDGSEVTIQRIEGDHAVAYNEQEIVLAAERGIEVR